MSHLGYKFEAGNIKIVLFQTSAVIHAHCHNCSAIQRHIIFHHRRKCYKNNGLITGKPSKPKGPLKVSDVTAEGCKLKWDKPEDDGGEPVDHYVIERMDTETGRWVPVGTSKTPEAEVCKVKFSG